MHRRLWRGLVVPLTATAMFGLMNAGSTAVAVDQTISQGVTLTVPGGFVAEFCATGEVSQCVTLVTGPSTVSGTLTVSVSTPDIDADVDVAPCGTAGVVVAVTGATEGGSIAANFTGTVDAVGAPPQAVDETVQVDAPSESDTLTASLCLQRG
ncbi:hypothetical protein E1265_19580 [Streptomyces sp. 8K308]|uniref:hypothetical protein n=1 Tax=Streptomyces sp. 8K308 TaxID=2530388 RepID=UPI00104D1F81|nr:hypothetical protein [Streptomyces sp. 8K308]TDC20944.1 hypothetical protein E1265_19580 [Streptomyces sp. 8K308]